MQNRGLNGLGITTLNSVPYSGKIESLSEHDIRKITFQTLKNDAVRTLDTKAYDQYDLAILSYVATSATARTLTESTTAVGTNNSGLVKLHVKRIADDLQERNIPVFDGENYVCISRPSTIREFRNELETIYQHTNPGYQRIIAGEIGSYEGIRFVTQTNVAAAATGVWASNNKSDYAFFFGGDTVTEAVACPEELRAKIASDYGRSKGIAWLN